MILSPTGALPPSEKPSSEQQLTTSYHLDSTSKTETYEPLFFIKDNLPQAFQYHNEQI